MIFSRRYGDRSTYHYYVFFLDLNKHRQRNSDNKRFFFQTTLDRCHKQRSGGLQAEGKIIDNQQKTL